MLTARVGVGVAECPPSKQPPGQPELLNLLETTLHSLVGEFPEARAEGPRGPGRPPIIPAAMLWLGFLLCVLRGLHAQRAIWRMLALHGFWGHPPTPITDSAIYQRLARAAPTAFQELFQRLTALLHERYAVVSDLPYAAFAADVIALDHSTLDAVMRKLKLLRGRPAGDPTLLPGRLATLFDVRRQLFRHVDFETDAQRNVKFQVERLLQPLTPGTLLLFDLGYFGFAWFDLLVEQGFHFISRLRAGTSWTLDHVLYTGGSSQLYLREAWIYLGKYKADRGAQPVRLVEVTYGGRTHRYITNVLDPTVLPAAHIVALYARRWDIEQAFNLLKTHLQLYLLWSGHQNVVLLQALATLIIAQVVLALRTELALKTHADLREISVPLLLESIPQLLANGRDPLVELALHGRRMAIIRPFRGRQHQVPMPAAADYSYPEGRPPPRVARYAGKDVGPGRPTRNSAERPERQRTDGWGKRKRRSGPR